MGKFSKGAVLLVCWVSISSGCSAQALFSAGIALSVGAERGLSSFSGWSPLPGWTFPLSRASSTLINWKLSSFGPLGICVLPPKRTVILAKKRDGSCLSAELLGQVPPSNCRIVIWKEKETLRARLGCRLPSCVPRPEEMICRGSQEPESSPPESENVGWRYAQKSKAVLELLSLAGAQKSTSGQYISSLCSSRNPVFLAGAGYPAERSFLLVVVQSLPCETPGSSQVPLTWWLCCLPPGYWASWS